MYLYSSTTSTSSPLMEMLFQLFTVLQNPQSSPLSCSLSRLGYWYHYMKHHFSLLSLLSITDRPHDCGGTGPSISSGWRQWWSSSKKIHDWGRRWNSWDLTGNLWVKGGWEVCLAGSRRGRFWSYFRNEPVEEYVLSRFPSIWSSFCLKFVISLIPDHISLTLFCWSLFSSFLPHWGRTSLFW